MLGDGSLLFSGLLEKGPGPDSVGSHPFRVVSALDASGRVGGRVSQDVLFTAGRLQDRRARSSALPNSHDARRTVAVSGDTIWVVPSERPELFALDPSGEVLLRVDWDAGDRTLPGGLANWQGIERYPAASALLAGTDGRMYVQRRSVQGGRPVRGPEWLVFGPAGDLLGRVHIPRSLRVLAFGAGRVLVQGTSEEGVDEVRLHALEVG